MKIMGFGYVNGDEKVVVKGMRRADKFCKMAVLGARRAMENSELKNFQGTDRVAVIISTQFGPHNTTFKFLDDIIDASDLEVSPIKFSHSVHNAAASYISCDIDSRGPTTTITSFDSPFVNALQLAELWLQEKRVDQVLVGYVEEKSEPMNYIRTLVQLSSYSENKLHEMSYFMLLNAGADGLQCNINDYFASPENWKDYTYLEDS